MKQIADYIRRLPAGQIANQLNETLRSESCVVVTAPPGAGKSTLLPLTILSSLDNSPAEAGDFSPKIIVLEPRRIAARQIATRMAEMLGERVGQTVGYRVRFDKCVSETTCIEVVTEGVLTRMLIDDPTLEGVSVIIFDEFHERSIHTDVALALARETQQLLREDLRLVVMSATIDTATLCQRLSAPLIESEGYMYPVSIQYGNDITDLNNLSEEAARATLRAHRESEGDILVFLPGQSDIERCRQLLTGQLIDTDILPLYGQLSLEEQRKAILPSSSGRRRVVLATNIAETSLTIEGIRVVVDTGYQRSLVIDQRSGLSHLETVRISRDMATQRAGRAGRIAEGTCYRLYSTATEMRMAENRTPEIMEADISPMLLDIAAWQGSVSERLISRLAWITPPSPVRVRQALDLLQNLNAIDNAGLLTKLGQQLSRFSCHPRIAGMILTAQNDRERALAADIAALLEEKDPMSSTDSTDINLRIDALRTARVNRRLGYWERIARVAAEYRRMIHAPEDNAPIEAVVAGRLIAHAYPERILRQGEYDWIAVAAMDAKTSRIYLSSQVLVSDLNDLISIYDNVRWDSRLGCVVAQREQRIGRTVVSTAPLSNIPQEQIVRIIADAAPKEGLTMFDFSDEISNLQLRIATVAVWHPELGLPDVSTEAVLRRADEWLPMFVGKAISVSELRKIDLHGAICSLLTYDQIQAVDRLAPTHIVVPTGSRIRLEYRVGAECPVLRVRLQECFGMLDTPRVNDGQQTVLMELLSPGFKPVQLTSDLSSFWTSTYFDVRKELRRRYPKHSWPDDPIRTPPTRGVARRNP